MRQITFDSDADAITAQKKLLTAATRVGNKLIGDDICPTATAIVCRINRLNYSFSFIK